MAAPRKPAISSAKDCWDKLDVIGRFIAGVILALVAMYLGWVYQDTERKRQHEEHLNSMRIQDYNSRSQRMSVMSQIITLFEKGTPNAKMSAMAILTTYGDDNIALQLSTIYPDNSEVAQAVDAVLASPSRDVQTNDEKNNRTGWLYLGSYKNYNWKTKHLNFPDTNTPGSLENRIFEVTIALNLRDGPPTPYGSLGIPVRLLDVGTKVRILEVIEWRNSGYQWASVGFP